MRTLRTSWLATLAGLIVSTLAYGQTSLLIAPGATSRPQADQSATSAAPSGPGSIPNLVAPAVLYGAAYSGADGLATLYRIDPSTGAATAIGPIGFQRVSGMDFDASGVLYANAERNDGSNTNVLIRIDPATGAGGEVGPTGVSGLGFGDHFSDVSFRPGDNALYGYIEGSDALGTINTSTGAAALVGPTGVACCGNGIAFSPGGVLFHANQANLNTLDQSTGTATLVMPLGFPPLGLFPRVNAMDSRPVTGVMYAAVRDNTPRNYLATVDTSTGAVSIIGASIAGLDAIAWGPPASVVAMPQLAPALYGSAYSGPDGLATLYRIDPVTGAGALIGPIGFQRVSGMDFDASGVLYANAERNDGSNTNVLITIDINTGTGTEVGPTGVAAFGFGDHFADISFRKSDGALYGYIESADGVATIDPATGAATLLGPSGVSSAGNGIAFNSADRLYHLKHDAINTLDQTTGAATFVTPLFFPPLGSNPRVNAADFHPDTGVLYGSVRDFSPANYLARIDTATGVVTIIGRTARDLDALAWGGITCRLIDFEGIPDGAFVGLITGPPDVSFAADWRALIDSDSGGGGFFANEPSPDTIAYYASGPGPIDLSAAVSIARISYTAHSSSLPVTLLGWDGPGGTGNLVASDTRSTRGVSSEGAPCTGDPTGDFCLFDVLTVLSPFNDIRSLTVVGTAPGTIGFDNLTICTGPPDLLYGAAYSGPDGLASLWRIDPVTAVPTFVGPTGYQRVSALDFDSTGRLFATGERNDGSNTNVLLNIDLATGAGTEVGPTTVLLTGFGDVFSDISFRNSDDKLYGYIEGGDGVGTINAVTGMATALGGSGVGCCGNGVAFDTADILFHANQANLNKLDQTTGMASLVTPLVYPGFLLNPRVNGMDFRPSTRILYASVHDNLVGSSLTRVDTGSGAVTSIAPTVSGLDAIAWLSTKRPPLPPEVSPSGAAILLNVTTPGPAQLDLSWESTVLSDSYRIISGDFFLLQAYGGVVPGNASTIKCRIHQTSVSLPMPAGNAFFIVAADNTRGTGPLGFASPSGVEETADLTCPCP